MKNKIIPNQNNWSTKSYQQFQQQQQQRLQLHQNQSQNSSKSNMGLTLCDEIDQLLQAHVPNLPPFRFQFKFNKMKKEWNKKRGFYFNFWNRNFSYFRSERNDDCCVRISGRATAAGIEHGRGGGGMSAQREGGGSTNGHKQEREARVEVGLLYYSVLLPPFLYIRNKWELCIIVLPRWPYV